MLEAKSMAIAWKERLSEFKKEQGLHQESNP
jgi:hypothetical protein